MKGPFFLVYGSELSVFRTKSAVESQIESPDIDDYQVFDSTGAQLTIEIDAAHTEKKMPSWVVSIDPVLIGEGESTERTRAIFSSHLRAFLGAKGRDASGRSINQLISDVLSVTEYQD